MIRIETQKYYDLEFYLTTKLGLGYKKISKIPESEYDFIKDLPELEKLCYFIEKIEFFKYPYDKTEIFIDFKDSKNYYFFLYNSSDIKLEDLVLKNPDGDFEITDSLEIKDFINEIIN
jgi:hypothetical protein